MADRRHGVADGEEEENSQAEDDDPDVTEAMCIEAHRAGRIGGALQWDRWFESACRRVDSLAARRGEDGASREASSQARTVSDVSTGRGDTQPGPGGGCGNAAV